MKSQISFELDMKDICVSNFILGMKIKRDHEKMKLQLIQRKFVDTILQRFSMQESKLINIPILIGVNLYIDQCPKIQEEEEDISQVPYASVAMKWYELDQKILVQLDFLADIR